MALHTFAWNEAHGITCKECLEKENLMAANIGASSSIPNPVNCSLLKDSSSSSENFTVEDILMDPESVTFLNNDARNPGNVAIEESLNTPDLPNPSLSFLFEKKLSATDCSIKAGRLLLPKRCAETFLPMPPEQQIVPLVIKDTGGRRWNFNLRWWDHKKSRKYVIDGIRRCLRWMDWNAGDKLKFYRQIPNGDLIMELQRAPACPSS